VESGCCSWDELGLVLEERKEVKMTTRYRVECEFDERGFWIGVVLIYNRRVEDA